MERFRNGDLKKMTLIGIYKLLTTKHLSVCLKIVTIRFGKVGKLAPTDAFDELSKILFIKIRDEKKLRDKGVPYDFQISTRDTRKSVARRSKRLVSRGKKNAIQRYLLKMLRLMMILFFLLSVTFKA